MPSPFVTPNMSLSEPAVGGTLSPSWALLLNANFATIDQHNHTTGMGVPIPPAGLNINSDLTFQGNNILAVNSMVLNGAVTGTPSTLSVYSNGTDLFYKDVNGNAIQLTVGGSPASGTGNIQGLPSTPTGGAGISWINSTGSFNMLADAGTVGANVEMGTLVLRYPGSYPTPSGTNFVALKVPAAIAAGYSLTLPSALPGSQKFATIDGSGNLAAPWAVDNSTLEIASSTTLQVKDAGVTSAKLASGAALANIGAGNITNTYLQSSITLIGNTSIDVAGHYAVAQNSTGDNVLSVIRGYFNNSGTALVGGSGFSVVKNSTGNFTVTITPAFASTPAITCSPVDGASTVTGYRITGVSSSGFTVITVNASNNATDPSTGVMFIAVGSKGF